MQKDGERSVVKFDVRGVIDSGSTLVEMRKKIPEDLIEADEPHNQVITKLPYTRVWALPLLCPLVIPCKLGFRYHGYGLMLRVMQIHHPYERIKPKSMQQKHMKSEIAINRLMCLSLLKTLLIPTKLKQLLTNDNNICSCIHSFSSLFDI